ncbi:hypothetical protein QWJ34_00425 [Saccharibacillus sp. CPCC 101409]|uniref:hypothetical protein n=1 Tax=Saccharibacillus sp. CPCC 101409 TaxID=3058041 RepID=UPI00267342E9|nr:hypothetical protein [Saccharibacillus sp. CPCC 101409]MDO3408222.1 hypothetical protein [Saccharibacillus sp. CPCC 101409]
MKLTAWVKRPGSRRGIAGRELDLPGMPRTLRELIGQTVLLMVEESGRKQAGDNLLPYLTETQIKQGARDGKVGFGAVYDEREPDADKSVAAALLGFGDGLYRVFLRGEEVTELDAPLTLADGDEVVFMRFTMLAGGLWRR